MEAKLDKYHAELLARADEHDLWVALRTVLTGKLEIVQNQLRHSPQVCDDDFSKDVRWLLGRQTVLEELLELPARAQQQH